MPSAFWSKPANKLKKCSERRIPTCDQDATDDCCEVVACTYCLIWETYGENPEYGTATFTGNSWEGSVGPISFKAFWERGYQSGECEFVVEANGEEVYRKSCYEGQSCRDSSDEASVSIPYAEGTLGWSKDLKRPLPHVTDYGTTCKRRWCGDCECTCECLCVTVVDGYTGATSKGEICDSGYECTGPVWAGTVGDVELSISLEADAYDRSCFLAISADGEDFNQDVIDCTDISFSIEMYDGTIIEGRCKNCSCERFCEPCPDPDVYPVLTVSVYPIAFCNVDPVDVVVTFNEISQSWSGSGPWSGTGDEISIILSCVGNSFMAQFRVLLSGITTTCVFGATSPTNQDCDLLLFDWEFIGSTGGKFCCGGGLIGSDIGMTVVL